MEYAQFSNIKTLGQLTSVTMNVVRGTTLSTPQLSTFSYDAVGNMTKEYLPGGVTNTYTYNSMNQVTAIDDVNSTATLFTVSYTYNDNGTRASSTETQKQSGSGSVTDTTTQWTYDALGRLTGETLTTNDPDETTYTNTYSYDLDSNRMSETDVSGGDTTVTTYDYNNDDEMTSAAVTVDGSAYSSTSYTYDANGSELTAVTTGTGAETTTNTFDVRNRLASVDTGGTTSTYLYDDDGDRVQETTGGTTFYYLIDSNNLMGYSEPIEVKSGSPTNNPQYTYIIGNRILGQANSSGATYYFLVDAQDSTRVITVGSNGNVNQTINYDAFGNIINEGGGTIFLFNGDGEFDTHSGLVFHGSGRQSNSATGTFEEMDDIFNYESISNPVTENPYIYGDGDPENVKDPSGHYTYSYYSNTSNSILGNGLFGDVFNEIKATEAQSYAYGALSTAIDNGTFEDAGAATANTSASIQGGVQVPGVFVCECWANSSFIFGEVTPVHYYLLIDGVGYGFYANSHHGGPPAAWLGLGVIATNGKVWPDDASKYPVVPTGTNPGGDQNYAWAYPVYTNPLNGQILPSTVHDLIKAAAQKAVGVQQFYGVDTHDCYWWVDTTVNNNGGASSLFQDNTGLTP